MSERVVPKREDTGSKLIKMRSVTFTGILLEIKTLQLQFTLKNKKNISALKV